MRHGIDGRLHALAILVGAAAVLAGHPSVAHAQFRFRTIYSSVPVNSSYSVLPVIQTADGGFATSGNTGSSAFLLKVDSAGGTAFFKTYNGVFSMPALEELPAGGFVLAGEERSFNNPAILRVDAAGAPLWAKSYDIGFGEQGFYVVHVTADGGYLASGIWALKVDATGTVLWSKIHIGGGGNVNGVALTSDGGSLSTGEGQNGNTGADYNLVVTRMDASGTIRWNKVYAGDGYGWGSDVKPTSDGGVIVTGWTSSFFFGRPNRSCFLLKTDANGALTWAKTYSGTGASLCQSVIQTADGGYAMTGELDAALLLAKTDAAGTLQWAHTWTGSATGYALRSTRDGGYVVGGVSGASDWLTVLKTDATGDASVCDQVTMPAVTVTAAPFLTGTNMTDGPTSWTPATLAPTVVLPTLTTSSPCGGCTATAHIQAAPSPLCAGSTVTLTSNGSVVNSCNGPVEYRFRGTNGFLRDWSAAPSAVDNPVASTTYTLDVRCVNPGCLATNTTSVTVDPAPTADAGASRGTCTTMTFTLGGAPTAGGGTPPFNYLWTAAPADPTLSCTSGPACSNPTAAPAVTTAYTLVVTDARGCTAGASVILANGPAGPPPDVGNTLRAVRGTASAPPDPTSVLLSWSNPGPTAVVYNVHRADGKRFQPPNGTIVSVPPGPGTRLAGELLTTPAVRFYRVTTSNCSGAESPL